jgi:hypothetical protein
MPRKYGDAWEVPMGMSEQQAFAKKAGVKVDNFATLNEFHSEQITINGEVPLEWGHTAEWGKKTFGKDGEIPSLRCPDCNSQAFKTDHPKVAVCGSYPGWYFFYRRLQDEHEQTGKTKYIIKNGEMVEVDETGKEIAKNL